MWFMQFVPGCRDEGVNVAHLFRGEAFAFVVLREDSGSRIRKRLNEAVDLWRRKSEYNDRFKSL
jgi:hypothetical protein